jgi:ankyrin repeat protein
MNIIPFLRRLFYLEFPFLAAVLFITLVWSVPAFCDEIHDAAKAGDLAKVKALLKNNPELVFSKGKRTLLYWAAYYGLKEVVELLLTKGADANDKDEYGDMAFILCADLVELQPQHDGHE